MRSSNRAGAALAMVLASQGGAAVAQDDSTVAKCGKSFGTLAVAEPQSGWGHLQRYGLGSPATLLRMMVQQSGCFEVVERGVAMQNLQQERALAQSGELRQESNLGQGQMQAADFVLTPVVQIGATDTGGIAGAMGGLLNRLGPIAALAGGLQFKEAETSILIADVRSSLQVAAAEGKASKTDFSIGGWGIGGGMAGALGGYTKSPEGKVVAASLLDNYNRIVATIRDKPQLIKPSSLAGDANAAVSTRAEAPQVAGQMLQAKIANVKVYQDASRDSPVVATLQRSDELVATGEAKNGFVRVDAANFSGWVQRTLVGPATGAVSSPLPARAPVAVALLPAPAVAYRHGNFVGNVDGAEKGSFRAVIDREGVITGDGTLVRTGVFGLMGKYDADEDRVMMMGSTASGSMVFVGRFDPSRREITGSWSFGSAGGVPSGQGAGGLFTARRQ